MKIPPVEAFARTLGSETRASVRAASAVKTIGRLSALQEAFRSPEEAREHASRVKGYVIANLKPLLLQMEEKCEANGIRVHWAADAERARQIILQICRVAAPAGGTIVKAKSMATEEIHLNPFLDQHGFKAIETDLGEYVVQLDGDLPSHIVTPIIHKNRRQVADAFEREGLGPRTDDPASLAMQARERLRSYFRKAKVGISGVNFAVAETGRLVLVENEGNNRFSTTAPDVHIALMGIEKVLPRESDLPVFLRLLACSATAQQMTSYVHLISGPRKQEADGPSEVHLILLDNGRTTVLNGQYRDILRCIRCGACLNVCPVYRQASGHAYGHVYSGPLGAVLAPALEGVEKVGWFAKASTLCGACEEVCPVRIPIPRMLLQLREEAERAQVAKGPSWKLFTSAASSPWKWRTGLKLLPMAQRLPNDATRGWSEHRAPPRREGRDFRSWWHARS